MPLAKTFLIEFNKILRMATRDEVQNIHDALTEDPRILSGKFYEIVDYEEKFCLFALLSTINTVSWCRKNAAQRIKYAARYARDKRGDQPISLEIFIQDRAALRKKPLLSKDEVADIINEAAKVLSRKE